MPGRSAATSIPQKNACAASAQCNAPAVGSTCIFAIANALNIEISKFGVHFIARVVHGESHRVQFCSLKVGVHFRAQVHDGPGRDRLLPTRMNSRRDSTQTTVIMRAQMSSILDTGDRGRRRKTSWNQALGHTHSAETTWYGSCLIGLRRSPSIAAPGERPS
jgi:hypothetical protein